MAAGVSLLQLQREASLSVLSISQPAVISSRPFSHRVQSARQHHVSQGDQSEVDQSNIVRSEKFPDINKLKITQLDRNEELLSKDQQLAKGSAFPNFRLLQRLAASAKGRISGESIRGNHLSHGINFSQEGDHHQSHNLETKHEDNSSEDDAMSVFPSSSTLKGPHRTAKVKKPHKRHKKAKTPARRSSRIPTDKQTDLNLQPMSSKVVPTFSKRFSGHGKSNARKRNSSEQSSCSENVFSTTRLAVNVNAPEGSLASNSLAGVGGIINGFNNDSRSCTQESSLRAIYEGSSNTAQSAPSSPLKKAKLRKVFQSEKQSGSISQCGRLLPCAPPTSPTPLLLEKYEIIPSLADFRSQQSIKQRLSVLEKDAKKRQSVEEKQKQKRESELLRVQLEAERSRTRQEIYALNKIMTKLERDHFKKFQEQMKNR